MPRQAGCRVIVEDEKNGHDATEVAIVVTS